MAIQENAIGAPLRFTVLEPQTLNPMDISAATTHDLIFQKPNGSKMTKLAVPFDSDGHDGKLKYTTVDGDLIPPGKWKIQAYIVKPGVNARTKYGLFDVLANI